MDTKSLLQLYLKFVRHFTISLGFFLKAIKTVFVSFPLFLFLLCVLYIVIRFYVLQAFLDLKLFLQGIFNLFQRLSERKYETFSRELCPRTPYPSCFYNFCISKRCTHNRLWHATAYIFNKQAFKLTTPCDCLMV